MNTGFSLPEPVPARPALTVSQLNALVAGVLADALGLVTVQGEVSNLTQAASGHWYFLLKDAGAQVRCVMFRGRNRFVQFRLRNGDRVEARASTTLYEARGEFQLTVEALRPAGEGELYRRFMALKRSLQEQGLFEADRKRPLPASPAVIGIVTSPKAAALRDVLTTLARRAPATAVILYPTPVQGVEAPAGIVAALARAAARRECEVLLLVRGGGSIEDLWAFNEEAVARAVVASPIPVVSGIGHETDFTIVDFVSDLRAPTPTAAAELAAPDRVEQGRILARLAHRLQSAFERRFERAGQRLDTAVRGLRSPQASWQAGADTLQAAARRLVRAHSTMRLLNAARLDRLAGRLRPPAPETAGVRLDSLARRLVTASERCTQDASARLARSERALALVSPQAVLQRGYAIVADEQGRSLVDAAMTAPGRALRVHLAQGALAARVERILDETGAG